MTLIFISITLASLLLGLVSTYLVRHLARRFDFVDSPDGRRKIQTQPIALGGGIGVFFTVVIVAAAGWAVVRHAPIIENQMRTVASDCKLGDKVGEPITATDTSPIDTLSFEIIDNDASDGFAIDPLSGQITVADAQTINFRTYDFGDRDPYFHLAVRVTDSHALQQSDTSTVTIYEADTNPPRLVKRPRGGRLPLIGLVVAGFVLFVVGLMDDRFGIRGTYKLLAQVIASSIVLGTGQLVYKLSIFGSSLDIGPFAFLFSLFWLLGAINSLNLIDGIDGLASSVGIIVSITLGIMAVMTGNTIYAVIAFSVTGALLGFLRYNFPPATIYLGDTGSMFIGLVLGTIALRCSIKETATLAFVAPLAVLTIPLLDSAAAIMRRKLTGRSIYATDRGHLHHRLLTHGLSGLQTLSLISGLCLITAIGAIGSTMVRGQLSGIIAVMSVIVVLAILVLTRVFGHVELRLLSNHLRGMGHSLLPKLGRPTSEVNQSSVQLQGSLEWEKVWEALVESAERFDLTRIRLNLHLPQIHEDFYATWRRKTDHSREEVWRAEFPLVVNGTTVGRLAVRGIHSSDSASIEVRQFMEFVEPIEAHIHTMLEESHYTVKHEAGASANGTAGMLPFLDTESTGV